MWILSRYAKEDHEDNEGDGLTHFQAHVSEVLLWGKVILWNNKYWTININLLNREQIVGHEIPKLTELNF